MINDTQVTEKKKMNTRISISRIMERITIAKIIMQFSNNVRKNEVSSDTMS